MVNLDSKLTLESLLPFGMIATKQWLLSMGLKLHSIDNALKSKKLVLLSAGVYARTGVPVTWQGVDSSLQKMSEQVVHVGGLSALELLGFGHYFSNKNTQHIRLYSRTKLPMWIEKLKLPVTFDWLGTKTLWSKEFLELRDYAIEHDWREDLPPVKLSCPEKAYLEMLMDVPDKISFDHANELMQGMTSQSPKKLAILLRACRNVKVKRLFFWLAERQGYSWSHKLDYRKLDLGKGKRVIASKGKLDNKFLITVPEHLHG
ncbi:MAG: type IV toxin-antitoxin system AbiEi family antitoxin [Thiotrichaceae bacterium]|nr:type IV toxin-antitoxin system AbiEi family antitoxin [Thiotrichaceae bacterium]